ncbi:MAG: hypothetical protein O3C10_03710 [Chloroflexi bacterium]|nr:hypothetical protein [Chloroflexota bacterium]
MGLPIGTVTVTTAGTRVQVVASGNAVSAVSFRARGSNSGPVYVGDDTVAAGDGYEISPGDEMTIRCRDLIDLRRFYIDAANNGDKVDYAGVAA